MDDTARRPSTAPTLEISPATIRDGETALVRLVAADLVEAIVSSGGDTFPLVQQGDVWLGYLPVPPLTSAGRQIVEVRIVDAAREQPIILRTELDVKDAQRVVESVTLDPSIAALLAPELVAIDTAVRFEEFTSISGPPRWRGAWRAPVETEPLGSFGALRSYNGAPPQDWHHGEDFSASGGSAVVAPAAGLVVFAGALPVHGNGVILDHGAGVYSGYWHMGVVEIAVGTSVARGDRLGSVGSSGLSTGPHLHWEVIVRGRDVDPIQWLGLDLRP